MANTINERDYVLLIEPVKQQMIRSIWRIVRDAGDAEEVLQESFEVIWKQIKKIKRHPNPHPLILRICICVSYDFLRKKIRNQKRIERMDFKEIPVESPHTASGDLLSKEIKQEIDSAIIQLPRRQAEAVLMRFIQDQPYNAIAQSMGCSETTVRTHIERGRVKLKQLLAHLEPETTS